MHVDVQLLGGFAVRLDGVAIPPGRWTRRHASAVVKLLALAPGRRLHRDRVIDALWPGLSVEAALPRLHKAAHYARSAVAERGAIVLRGETVSLFPDHDVRVDAVIYEAAAEAAVAEHPVDPGRCADLLAGAAELLPEDVDASWLDQPRERLRLLSARLAKAARRWEEVLRFEPADETAHLELIRAALARGDRHDALRRYAQLTDLLATELGVAPSAEAVALYERASATADPPVRPSPGGSASALVERDAELDDLTVAVRSAIERRRGIVILISGEPGAGKSALARALVGRLSGELSAHVGGCDDLLAPRSLGPFRDMADTHPEIAAALGSSGLASAGLEEVLPALLRVVAARPFVMVVEDVHWADDATLDTIRYLARRLVGVAGALLLTFREADVEPDHPLRQVLGSFAGLPIHRVTLPPLSAAAVCRLGGVTTEEADEIIRVTAGNPFFVTEVLSTRGDGVPATVRDAVLARVARLPPPVRAVLRRLSVVPGRAERVLTEILADGDPCVVIEAERSGVVVADTEWVAFRHELARQAIETSLLPGERIEANMLVVQALLAGLDVDPARVVHHAQRAGQTDLIRTYGPKAAREASALGAHRQAAEILRVVLQHSSRLGERDRADLWRERAYSLYVVNRFEEALTCAEQAVRAAESTADTALLADALLVLARAALFARGPARARDAATRALDALAGTGDVPRRAAAMTELARAHSNLATVGIVAEPCDRAAVLSEEALGLARRIARFDLVAQALCYRGDARLSAGDPRGAADLEQAISLAGSDPRIETRVRAYVNAAGGAYRSGRFDQAAGYVAEGLQVAADGEFFAGQYRLRLTGALVQASRGNWDLAVGELEALVQLPGEPGVMRALARSVLARLLARRGSAQASAVLAVALSDAAFGEDRFVTGTLSVAAVELGWLDGSLGALTPGSRRALELTRGHYAAVHAELIAYLRRAGVPVAVPRDAPGPWQPTLDGRWEQAATAWSSLGDRYELALTLVTAPDRSARRRGVSLLEQLGAVAAIQAVG